MRKNPLKISDNLRKELTKLKGVWLQ